MTWVGLESMYLAPNCSLIGGTKLSNWTQTIHLGRILGESRRDPAKTGQLSKLMGIDFGRYCYWGSVTFRARLRRDQGCPSTKKLLRIKDDKQLPAPSFQLQPFDLSKGEESIALYPIQKLRIPNHFNLN